MHEDDVPPIERCTIWRCPSTPGPALPHDAHSQVISQPCCSSTTDQGWMVHSHTHQSNSLCQSASAVIRSTVESSVHGTVSLPAISVLDDDREETSGCGDDGGSQWLNGTLLIGHSLVMCDFISCHHFCMMCRSRAHLTVLSVKLD